MDVEAAAAALSPQALAPGIARGLGLRVESVEAALALLAEGAQPAFVARYRADRVDGLDLRALERIQAAAARAAAFEFQRQSLRHELQTRGLLDAEVDALVHEAEHALELEDVRALLRKRKRGPNKARVPGAVPLAQAIVRVGIAKAIDRRRGRERPREVVAAVEVHEHADEQEHEHDHDHDDAHAHDDARAHDDAHAHDDARAHDDAHAHDDARVDAEAPGQGDEVQAEGTAPVEAPVVEAAREGKPPRAPLPAIDDAQLLQDPLAVAGTLVTEGFTAQDVLAGACTLVAERIAEWPELRMRLRRMVGAEGKLRASIIEGRRDKAARYAKLTERAEPCASVPSSVVLALHRGERENVLTVELEVEEDAVVAVAREVLGIVEGPIAAPIEDAVREAWRFSLGKAVKSGARRLLKERADRDAIAEYAEALRPMLLAPAFGAKPVLGIDPAFAPGCRLAAVDATGKVVEHDTVFPLQPKLQAPQAKARILELCTAHQVGGIAIADAGGGREVERLVRELVRETPELAELAIVLVDGDTVGLLAASRASKDELGEDAQLRRAVSCARRLQDPLGELAKVDPRKLGLGQYQHEVDQEELRAALEQVVSSSVCEIGVDVNEAAPDLLAKVAGLSHALSRAIATHRQAHGPLRTRSSLFDLPGIAGKTFEQASGFLRIQGGENPLDATAIHPERYGQITQMAREIGVTIGDLLGNAELVDRIDPERWIGTPGVAGEPLGPRAFEQVRAELRDPARDVRPPFVRPAFDPGLASFADLSVGMELEGVVTRIANFGAFVDVGLPQEALVHVSELSHGFTSRPSEVVHIGQCVKGRVIEVDPERKRFSLSLRALQPRPPRPERPSGDGPRRGNKDGPRRGKGDDRRDHRGNEGDQQRAQGNRDERRPDDRGERRDDRGKGGKPGGGKGRRRDEGKERPEKRERTLGFRLDLSAFVDRVQKG